MPLLAPQSRKINLRDFAREIYTDLPTLMETHPLGVTISDLYEFYGESSQRIARAIEILVLDDKIERKRRASRTIYILPKGWNIPRPYPELTHLQWKVLEYIQQNANQDGNYHTNYSRVSDALGYSGGGTKSAVLRLIEMGHLRPVSPYSKDVREAVFHVEDKPIPPIQPAIDGSGQATEDLDETVEHPSLDRPIEDSEDGQAEPWN